MNKKTILALIIASALSPIAGAAELPEVGTFNAGIQVSSGTFDHDTFSADDDAVGQVMVYIDYYFKPGWAVEVGVNSGSNVQDWICAQDDVDADEEYCTSSDDSDAASVESDLDFNNFIVAVRYDKQVTENSFVYGKLGAQYYDYEMENNNAVFEEDSGTGVLIRFNEHDALIKLRFAARDSG